MVEPPSSAPDLQLGGSSMVDWVFNIYFMAFSSLFPVFCCVISSFCPVVGLVLFFSSSFFLSLEGGDPEKKEILLSFSSYVCRWLQLMAGPLEISISINGIVVKDCSLLFNELENSSIAFVKWSVNHTTLVRVVASASAGREWLVIRLPIDCLSKHRSSVVIEEIEDEGSGGDKGCDVNLNENIGEAGEGANKFHAFFEAFSTHGMSFDENPYDGNVLNDGTNDFEVGNEGTSGIEWDLVDHDYILEEGDDNLVEGIENARTRMPKPMGRPKGSSVDAGSIIVFDPMMQFELDDNSSEYAKSDELHSKSDSDSDIEQRPKFPEFNAQMDMQDPPFQIGMLFDNPDQFRKACRHHAVNNRFDLKFKKNTTRKIDVCCKGVVGPDAACSWRAYAAKFDTKDEKNPTMQLRNGYFTHDCAKVNEHPYLTSKWLAKKYLEDFRSDQDWKVQALIDRVQREMQLKIGRMKGYRAKCFALEIINGDERSQYDKTYRYMAEILRSNPGSTIKGRWKEGRFMGMYVCLNALKSAFKAGCRKFISLDGCFLKGRYKGQLLSAVGIDPNDCMFPIAYAMVETESTDTWLWFLELLADDLDIENSIEWTFMSDRQKGLINAVESLFPDAEHRLCVRHMYTNLRTKFKSKELKDLLWNAARAPYVEKLNEWLDKIEQKSPEAREWLRERSAKHWARSCFSVSSKCDMLLNNLCECFNKYILDARDKGLITMFEMIKLRMMKRLKSKSDIMKKYQKAWCPKILKKLEINKDFAKHFQATFTGTARVQINGLGKQYVVEMDERKCSCGRWQLNGIPCSHAIASIYGQNQSPETYLDDCYSVETYLKVYSFFIEPTNDMDQWPHVESPVPIIPPSPVKTKRGRKKKARRKEPEELEGIGKKKYLSRKGLVKMSCSNCKGISHNIKTCKVQKSTPSLPQPKRKRTAIVEGTNSRATNASAPTSGPQIVRWMMDGSSQTSTSTQFNQNHQSVGLSSQPSQASNVRPDAPRRPMTNSGAATGPSIPWR